MAGILENLLTLKNFQGPAIPRLLALFPKRPRLVLINPLPPQCDLLFT
jgi:hypothetical protein